MVVVEDQADTRELIAALLAREGAEVAPIGQVRGVLGAVERFGPHLLVLDLTLPDGDGCDLLEVIRTLPHDRGRIPAIALTAHAGSADRLRTIAAGFQAHLAKPVDPLALLTTAANVVGMRVPPPRPRGGASGH